jgi:hypothetical protein
MRTVQIASVIGGLLIGLGPAVSATEGFGDYRPAARRDAPLAQEGARALAPISQSATDDEATDPAPPGSPALLAASPGVTALSGRLLQASEVVC